MADRETKVKLSLQMQQYLDGMEKARKATRDAATEAERLAETKRQFDMLGRTAVATGGLIAIGLGVAVAKFAEFDQAMSNVAAASGETAENMQALTDAALDAGASTVFSATEAAGAIEELSKAGVSTADILSGALAGSLDLAAAGGIEVAEAAGIAATALQQFGLEGTEATRVADLLAAGAGKAMGSVSDISMALKQSGLVADQFGISIEETVGALAAFASQGLLGSDAGTSFKTMLTQLAKPSAEASKLMEDLGINAYDTSGQFVGLEGLAAELEEGLAGLTDQQRQSALATIFGTDAIRAATVLYEEGAEGIADWTASVDDAGYAAEQAEARLDNLKGDIEALQGAFETAMIGMGAAADGPLRGLVQGITGVVDTFNALPAAGQQAVFWIGSAAAAASTAYGAYLLLVPKIAEFNEAIELLGPKAARTARALSTVAKVGAGALAGFTTAAVAADVLVEAFQEAGLSGEDLANKIKTASSAVELFNAQQQKTAVGGSNIGLAAAQVRELGDALDAIKEGTRGDLIDAKAIFNVQRLGEDLAELAQSDLPAAQEQFRRLTEEADLTVAQQSQLLDLMAPFRDELTRQATEADEAATSQSLLNRALGDTPAAADPASSAIEDIADEAADAEANLSAMKDALAEVNSTALGMSEALDAAQSAINDLGKAGEVEGVSIQGLDDDSIAFRDAIRDVEQAHRDAAEAILENGGTLDEARGKYQEGRDAIVEMLEAKGLDAEAARQWADDTLGEASDVEGALRDVALAVTQMPEKKTITLVADTSPAMAAINRFVFDNNGRRISFFVDGYEGRRTSDRFAAVARAGGGEISGPGPRGVDSVPVYAAPGEHMLTAADVDAMGGQHAVYAFRDSLHGGSGGSGLGASVTQNVYPTPGMSEEQIARISAEKISFALRG